MAQVTQALARRCRDQRTNQAIAQMNEVTQQNAAMVEEAAARPRNFRPKTDN